jgi:hypothetical protein
MKYNDKFGINKSDTVFFLKIKWSKNKKKIRKFFLRMEDAW